MPRKYPFTRTIKTQIVTALVFDKETAEPSNISIIIPTPIADRAKLERVVAKNINTSTVKFIEIVDIKEDEALYGITLEDFMAHAVRLDPETRKAIDEKSEE